MKQTYGCNHEDVPDPFDRTFRTKMRWQSTIQKTNMVFLDAKVVSFIWDRIVRYIFDVFLMIIENKEF